MKTRFGPSASATRRPGAVVSRPRLRSITLPTEDPRGVRGTWGPPVSVLVRDGSGTYWAGAEAGATHPVKLVEHIEAERSELAALRESLNAEELGCASLCEGCSVRDVAAHV